MKSTVVLLAVVFGFAVLLAAAQTHTFAALDINNTWTGQNIFTALSNFTGPVTLTPSAGNTVNLLNAQANGGAIQGNGFPQTLYTYTLPANTIGTLKGFRIIGGFNHSTGSASVTYVLNFNGLPLFSVSSGTTGAGIFETTILNTGATTGTSVDFAPFASYTNNLISGLAWGSPQTLQLTFNVASTDSVTPTQWVVEAIQ
jgi:hypothetical protein